MVQWGAFAFGFVIGWFTYFVNRYRSEVALADVAVILAAVGGGVVVDLFPEPDLFGYYGVGLAGGFFLYLLILVVLVRVNRKHGWTSEWFLDGRRPPLRDLPTAAGKSAHQQGGTESRGMDDQRVDPSLQLGG